MNMKEIYAYESQRSRQTQFVTQKDSTTTYEIGQMLDGIISNVSEQISIDFSGREVKVPKSAVKNAKEGETRTFQIMDISKNGIVLKEVGSTTKQGEVQKKNSLLFTQVDVDASTVVKEDDSSKEEQADLDKLSSTITEKDYEELKNQGVTLESYSLTQLERALMRVKAQRNERATQTVEQVAQLKSELEKIQKMVQASYASHPALEQVIEQLLSSNMPVTPENISRFIKTQDMTSAIAQLSESSASYLIKNELPPTIENIYKAVHSGEKTKVIKTQEEYLQVKSSIEQLVEDGQYEDASLVSNTAKWLFMSDLPVTQENIEYKLSLDQLKNHLDNEWINQSIVKAVKAGNRPEKANLLQSDDEEYEQFMQQLDEIEDTTLAKAVEYAKENKTTLNLQSLIQLQSEQRNLSNTNQTLISVDSSFDVAAITAKRQLEEIRLKLTFEAAVKLSTKGFQIETQELSKVVEELKNLEQTYYESVMKNVTGSAEGTNQLMQVQEAVFHLKQSSTYLLSQTFPTRHIITLEQLNEVSTQSVVRAKQAEASYEALMTSPRKDLGDSIQKAFANVDSQLQMLGMEVTRDNQRAVRILGYNSMELTVENVTAMKAYDVRVNELLNNLTPDVTAALIKDRHNPLHMTVDEASELAFEYKQQLGNSEQKKYSEFLVDLENKKEITAQEREAYIGIYRLLYQVEQSDGAAVGALVKSGKELTLNNLLTEIRTKKQGYMDVNIDDTTPITSSTGYVNSITESIDSYYSEQTSYAKSLVHELRSQLDVDRLYELKESQKDTFNTMSLEAIKDSLSVMEQEESSYVKQTLNQLSEMSKQGTEILNYLSAYEQVDSLNHMLAVTYGINNSTEIYNQIQPYLSSPAKEKLKEQTNQLLQSMGEEEEFKDSYEQLTEVVLQGLSNAINEVSSAKAMQDVTAMFDYFALNQSLAKKNHYNIPVQVKGNMVNMNLTVLHNSQAKGQIRIQLPVDERQTLTVQASVNQNQVNAWITTGNPLGRNESEQIKAALLEQLTELGFTMNQLHISCEMVDRERFIFANGNIYKETQTMDTSGNEALTSDLLQVSKVFVDQLIKLA